MVLSRSELVPMFSSPELKAQVSSSLVIIHLRLFVRLLASELKQTWHKASLGERRFKGPRPWCSRAEGGLIITTFNQLACIIMALLKLVVFKVRKVANGPLAYYLYMDFKARGLVCTCTWSELHVHSCKLF